MAEYEKESEKLAALEQEHIGLTISLKAIAKNKKAERKPLETKLAKLEKTLAKPRAKIAERDERIAESRRRAEDDRAEVTRTGEELTALYADPDELLKHARVVDLEEIEENECNLNIPRYVDTFEPEPRVEVKDALEALRQAEDKAAQATNTLATILKTIGYETN